MAVGDISMHSAFGVYNTSIIRMSPSSDMSGSLPVPIACSAGTSFSSPDTGRGSISRKLSRFSLWGVTLCDAPVSFCITRHRWIPFMSCCLLASAVLILSFLSIPLLRLWQLVFESFLSRVAISGRCRGMSSSSLMMGRSPAFARRVTGGVCDSFSVVMHRQAITSSGHGWGDCGWTIVHCLTLVRSSPLSYSPIPARSSLGHRE